MPEKPSCNKDAACELNVRGRKKGCVVTAECVKCEFLYEVGKIEHKNQKGSPNKGHAAKGYLVGGTMHGTIPIGLDIGQVSTVVNGALHNPDILDHLTIPIIE